MWWLWEDGSVWWLWEGWLSVVVVEVITECGRDD